MYVLYKSGVMGDPCHRRSKMGKMYICAIMKKMCPPIYHRNGAMVL